jgi:hypothetical protein
MRRSRLCWALPAILPLWLAAAAGAPPAEFRLQLKDLAVFDLRQGPAAGRSDHFDWQATRELGILVSADLSGQFKDVQKLKVFVAVADAAGQVVYKSKEDYWVYPGEHSYELKPVLVTADYFGRQQFTVELEASMKGFDTIKRQLVFSVDGPPAPRVFLERLEVLDNSGDRRDIFGPNDEFSVAAGFRIEQNQLPTPLQLVLTTDELPGDGPLDLQQVSAGIAADNTTVLNLAPGANGHWRVEIGGRTPQSCANWQQQFHPFRVYALVRSGKTVLAGDSRLAVLFDPRPEPGRRGRSTDRRSTAVAPPQEWRVQQN